MIPDRWNRIKFNQALHSPNLFLKEIRRLPLNIRNGIDKRLLRTLSNVFAKERYSDSINVMEEDWDNLIILDACRYDYFVNQNFIDGDLSREISIGSGTTEFIKKTFIGNTYHDTVCISPNTKFTKYLDEDKVFYKLINNIDYSPTAVYDAGVKAHKEFDDKRIIVHFMTPHSPFIGTIGNQIRRKFKAKNPPIDKSLLRAAQHGYISDFELSQAYRENVEIAIDHANKLIQAFGGKTIVTADHGEMLGEKEFGLKYYGHAVGLYTPGLRYVPWLVVDSNSRRDINTADPVETERLEDREVKKRLQDLGYKA